MKNYSLLILPFVFFATINNAQAQIGIGTTTPGNSLEINGNTNGNSGLRFTRLNSSEIISATPSAALGVNTQGDVTLYSLGSTSPTEELTDFKAYNINPYTIYTIGEIQFRYNFGIPFPNPGGNIEFRSNSTSTLPITCIRHEEYAPVSGYLGGEYFSSSLTLNPNSGGFTTINAGGLDGDETLIYNIFTDTGSIYEISIIDRSATYFYIYAQKIR
ncbi:MAG: hypothetical protein QM535_14670 [Limnohabitans sp.]|nr:hypothetical protein [Limnohabitans sp.]